jgi:general secretion pathway protein D
MPLQVMIEVLVIQLTIDDQTRAGIDWAFKTGSLAVGSAAASQSVSVGAVLGQSATAVLSQGFSIVAQSENFTALLQAFAEDSKLNVLSNPILITSENKPASINITNDIPIETSTISTPTAGQPLTETSIQYRSVGIKLNITPQINRDRFVALEISQESSNVNEAASFSQPAFFTRSTDTNVVVKDKQTLVIGGLMETTKSHSNTGVPILKDIPFFGRLFKAKSDRLRKTELIIFITPHVIADISEANQATKSFRSKLLNITKDFKLKKRIN